MKNGLIRKSKSKTVSPLVLVKKGDSFRVTQDVSLLNESFVTIRGFIPFTKEIINNLDSKNYYSEFDMWRCYHQFSTSDNLCSLYAFSTPSGVFEWNNRLPLGDKNIPVFIHMKLTEIFKDLPFVSVYFDNFIIADDDEETHLEHIKLFLERCKEVNIKFCFEIQCCSIGYQCVGLLFMQGGLHSY